MLDAVPAGTCPSPTTGEPFNCIVWVETAMIAPRDRGFITPEASFPEVRVGLENRASFYEPDIIQGQSSAKVQN